MVDDVFPNPSTDDTVNFRYPSGPLGPDAQMQVIGGTHNVSARITPEQALTGGYTPIPGDSMPPGCPVDGNPAYVGPYLPRN